MPVPIDCAPFERGDHVEIGERLVNRLRAEAPTTFTDGAFYQYDTRRGVFASIQTARLSRIVQSFAGSKVKGEKKPKPLRLKAHDINGAIQLASHQVDDAEFFAAARSGIAFRDSFVEVSPERIVRHQHAPEHRARFAYGFDFAPAQSPARLLAFFAEVFRDDADVSDKVRLIQEYLGISLLGRATQYQRAIVCEGDGANGKGVLSSVAERCFPPGSTCSIPPQDVGQEYRRAVLAGKLLNIVSELPEADIMDSESWKSVVAGDTMTGREIRQSPFTFKPIAGHIYSANRLPGTTDQTHGFWRRLLVVKFDRIFAESEQNPRLADQILESETPAIVAWILAGAQRALAQGGFTMPTSSAQAKDRWRSQADQVRAFVDAWTARLALDASPLDGTKADALYRSYRSWAAENGHRPLASNTFGERMRLLGLPSHHTKVGGFYPVQITREEGAR